MSATMNDVVLAILAMDSYNHGYNPGMAVSGYENIDGATIFASSADTTTSFYALAYNWNGQSVISYRGTVSASTLPDIGDILFGWTFGGGLYHLGVQSEEAALFFQQIAEHDNPKLAPGGLDPADGDRLFLDAAAAAGRLTGAIAGAPLESPGRRWISS
jgi:hypothetical protein